MFCPYIVVYTCHVHRVAATTTLVINIKGNCIDWYDACQGCEFDDLKIYDVSETNLSEVTNKILKEIHVAVL